jgi:hypothetical protein
MYYSCCCVSQHDLQPTDDYKVQQKEKFVLETKVKNSFSTTTNLKQAVANSETIFRL